MRKIYYTADLITPDGSDSWNGEPCEPGTGAVVSNGWYSPDWSRTDVYDTREDVTPDVWGKDVDPAVWLANTLNERLSGWPESNGDGTWYSGEGQDVDHCSGINVSVAAHAEGFTDTELGQAEDWLRHVRNGGYLTLDAAMRGDLDRENWED